MRFLLLIRHDGSFTPPIGLGDETTAWMSEIDARGIRLHGERLAHYSEAVTVTERDGGALVENGPLGTGHQVAGYDLIEADGPARALAIASAHPMSRWGLIEIREVWTPPARPQSDQEDNGTHTTGRTT